MRLDKLAVTAQEAFQAAMGIASDADTSSVEPIHLLKALLDAGENNISAIIKRVGADPAMLSGEVDKAITDLRERGDIFEKDGATMQGGGVLHGAATFHGRGRRGEIPACFCVCGRIYTKAA